MQYVLTQEEYDDLVPKQKLKDCQDALTWMRVKFLPDCIHVKPKQYFNYCGRCPIDKIEDRGISKAACPLDRAHGK